ncbi:MAG: hypothetical protein E7636_03830 [Ruminococcaceae bacterium]|nr:hypothetical protein [Oscillospiraceae bacterium]
MQKTLKSKNVGVTVAGIVILALALIIIFFTIFVPRLRENKILRERVELLLTAEYERMLLSDPLMESQGAIADRGVQIMLTGEEVRLLREKLVVVEEAGFTNADNIAMIEGAWDTKWQIRTVAGEYESLYFTESALYFYADGTAFCFEPKDLTAYDVFYTCMREMLLAK